MKQQVFEQGAFKLVPIRDEDKNMIMQWRNEQMYHLRQAKPLTAEMQENYFATTVSALFEEDQPKQILFSYLKNDVLVGYGGLVHISWEDRRGEVSFIIDTELETQFFEFHWINYLKLIEKVSFEELLFHKIFTYAFDLRPHLYVALEKSNFIKEATLKEHCYFEGKFIDVIIHSKINSKIHFRNVKKEDIDLYFDWANDETTRSNSFSSEKISYETHCEWFLKKIEDRNTMMLVFENEKDHAIGQVRIEKKQNENVIGISIDKNFRGKGFASVMIDLACEEFFKKYNSNTITAYIKKENTGSLRSFQKANFQIFREEVVDNICNFVLGKTI
jgi:RimJ/RimL family protein N-acetyltransferase